ncbi:hypothetical protein BDZ45DRAFT_678885 [Acephala macrosclerotiorum]|nr:hypothetical protein BDZ45DRAFT_678885 [Acephala macrosclerotiorum]
MHSSFFPQLPKICAYPPLPSVLLLQNYAVAALAGWSFVFNAQIPMRSSKLGEDRKEEDLES